MEPFYLELSQIYSGVKKQLESMLLELNGPGNNEKFLQKDLVMRVLNLKPEIRPSVERVMHHLLFWADKKYLEIILELRKQFDVLDPKLAIKIRDEHHKVLDETLIVQKLKIALDSDKSVVPNLFINFFS